jgi:hypothetical protein
MSAEQPSAKQPAAGTPRRGSRQARLRPKGWWGQLGRGGQGTLLAAVVTGLATIAAAMVATSNSRPSTPESSFAASNPPAIASKTLPRGPKPDCPGPSMALPPGSAVDITNLKDEDPVDYDVTDVKGTATLAPEHFLWFLVWGPTSEQMYVMGGGHPIVDNGLWTFKELGLGDGSGDDEGKYFCITAMIVNADGNTFFEKIVATRKETSWAMTKDEIPKEGLVKTVVVWLRNAKKPATYMTN